MDYITYQGVTQDIAEQMMLQDLERLFRKSRSSLEKFVFPTPDNVPTELEEAISLWMQPEDHSVVYAVATDGGLGLNERFVGGEECDAVYCRDLDAGTMALGGPAKLVGLEWRYSDLDYMESGLGIVEEYRRSDPMERRWILDEKAGGRTKRLLYERTWEDWYTAPGRPLMRRGSRGQFFVMQPTLKSMYLQGSGASPLGDRPFLDLLDFSTEDAKTTRLWRSAAPLEGELDATKEWRLADRMEGYLRIAGLSTEGQ